MWPQKLIKMASFLQIFVVSENDSQGKERIERCAGSQKKWRAREKSDIGFPPWCLALTTVNSESSSKVRLVIYFYIGDVIRVTYKGEVRCIDKLCWCFKAYSAADFQPAGQKAFKILFFISVMITAQWGLTVLLWPLPCKNYWFLTSSCISAP